MLVPDGLLGQVLGVFEVRRIMTCRPCFPCPCVLLLALSGLYVLCYCYCWSCIEWLQPSLTAVIERVADRELSQ